MKLNSLCRIETSTKERRIHKHKTTSRAKKALAYCTSKTRNKKLKERPDWDRENINNNFLCALLIKASTLCDMTVREHILNA